MMNILVTGGAGFIGSNFVRYMLEKYKTYKIINIDNLTYAGNLENLKGIDGFLNYHFIKGDIINRQFIDSIAKKYEINVIINFAAESHVDRSIEEPEIFITTNILGTQTLLDVGFKNEIQKFIQISTDEVYGTLGKYGYFTEDTPLAPNSPYSASKASADFLVRSYYETYGMNVNITRCSNNYGPYQFIEKLIPLMITNAIENKSLPVYGDGLNVRDWLHVYDHCSAIDIVLHKGLHGEVYNIGGHNERTNITIINKILNYLGKSNKLITYIEDRKGHDYRYAINPNKIMNELGWAPVYDLEVGLEETIEWYLDNNKWLLNVQNKYKSEGLNI